MTTTKINVRVNFIGEIWMPSVTCGSSFTLSESDNARMSEPWNLLDDAECLEFVEHFLNGEKSGDFQSVTDFEAIREVTNTTDFQDPTGLLRMANSNSKFTTLHAWDNEENECTWIDCTFGVEA